MAGEDTSKLPPSGQPLPLQPGEFRLTGQANMVTFGLQNVGPPSPLYVQRDDQLFVSAVTSGTNESVRINVRFLRPDGVIVPLQFIMAVGTIYTRFEQAFQLAEGFILSVYVSAVQALVPNNTYVSVSLVRGSGIAANIQQLLAAGSVTQRQGASWPGGGVGLPGSGVGFARTIAVSSPFVGVDWTLSGTQFVLWRIISVTAQLVTSAAVANRSPRLTLTGANGGGILTGVVLQAQLASLTVFYVFAMGATAFAANAAGDAVVGVGNHAPIGATPVIATSTRNLQAADQWSAITVNVEEFLTV